MIHIISRAVLSVLLIMPVVGTFELFPALTADMYSTPVSANDWEKVKNISSGVKKFIGDNMRYKSCVVVLVGVFYDLFPYGAYGGIQRNIARWVENAIRVRKSHS